MTQPEAPALPLFVYGSLREPDVQQALWGTCPPARSAHLHGWQLVTAADGHAFLTPLAGAAVTGELLQLDVTQQWRADQWELPLYLRQRLLVRSDAGDPELAQVYIRQDGAVASENLAGAGDTVASVTELRRSAETLPFAKCDAWLLIAGRRIAEHPLPEPARPLECQRVLTALERVGGPETWRRGMPTVELDVGGFGQQALVTMAWNEQATRCAVAFALPALHLGLADLGTAWHPDRVMVRESAGAGDPQTLAAWLQCHGAVWEPPAHLLLFADQAPADLAPLRCGPDSDVRCSLLVPRPFADAWEQRLAREAAAVVAQEARLLARGS